MMPFKAALLLMSVALAGAGPVGIARARKRPPFLHATAPASVTVDTQTVIGVNTLTLGVTHTQYSLDSWGDPASIARGTAVLEATSTYQNQHIMGWGATPSTE